MIKGKFNVSSVKTKIYQL